MRQKLRKYIKDFDEDMAKFRENPDAADDEEAEKAEESDEEEESKDEDFEPVTKASDFKKKSKSTTPADDEDDESDDSYWDSDSDEESSSSSDDDQRYASLRERFLKKTTDKDDDKKEKKAKDKAKKKEKKIQEEDESEDEGWIKVDGGSADKPKMFDKDAEINHELVVKKLREIMAARGRKRTNRKEQIELLNELYHISEEHNLGIGMAVKIKFADISAIFDYNPKISAAMKPEYWEKCVPAVDQLLDMIGNNTDCLTTGEHILEDSESFETKPYK